MVYTIFRIHISSWLVKAWVPVRNVEHLMLTTVTKTFPDFAKSTAKRATTDEALLVAFMNAECINEILEVAVRRKKEYDAINREKEP